MTYNGYDNSIYRLSIKAVAIYTAAVYTSEYSCFKQIFSLCTQRLYTREILVLYTQLIQEIFLLYVCFGSVSAIVPRVQLPREDLRRSPLPHRSVITPRALSFFMFPVPQEDRGGYRPDAGCMTKVWGDR